MRAVKQVVAIAVSGVAFSFCSSFCVAQHVTGELGSPSATTTISGKQLPPPDPKFGGVIKEKASESKAWWPPRVVPPEGRAQRAAHHDGRCRLRRARAPSAAWSRPRRWIASPRAGCATRSFIRPRCARPRAPRLITGRNHHAAGFGVVGEAATGFPGYDSIIRKDVGTIGTILKEHGYATSWFGKDHNTPFYQLSQAGPFDQWPVGMGFDYFYGFIGGYTSHEWQPESVPQHDGHLPLSRQSRLESDHRDGG